MFAKWVDFFLWYCYLYCMDTNQNLNSYNVDFRKNAETAIKSAYSQSIITRTDALLLWDAKVIGMSQADCLAAHGLTDRRTMVLRRNLAWTKVRNHMLP